MINLDKGLVDEVKGLKLEYKDTPQPELLIKIPNWNDDVDYEVEVLTDEFTSLCPLNIAQPDYATIVIWYKPRKWLVELKSLKFYLVAFRMCPVFHEQVPATILRDLVALLDPRELVVTGVFTTRGGIETTVMAQYSREVERIE